MTIVFVLYVSAFFVLPVLAAVALTLGITGRRFPTRPLCRACAARLPFIAVLRGEPCPACGGEVETTQPAQPLVVHPTWWLVVIAALLVALAFGAYQVANEVQRQRLMMVPATRAVAGSLPEIVDRAVRGQWTLDANVLAAQEKVRTGAATSAEVRSALTATLDNAAKNGPPIPPGAPLCAVAALALADGGGDDAFRERILDTCFFPTQPFQALTDTQPRVQWRFPEFLNGDAGLARIVVLKRVLVDGAEVPFTYSRPDSDAAVIQAGDGVVHYATLAPLSPGKHDVAIEVEEWLMTAFDAPRVRDPNRDFLPVSDWPMPLYKRSKTITTTIETPSR